MNAQLNILMLADGIWTIPGALCFIALIVVIVIAQYTQDENQKRAQEKVMELTEKGHEAKLCPKCKGKGVGTWRACAECGGLGYIYKLRKSEEGLTNAGYNGGLQKCANCGATIGKIEKNYVFEDHVVCSECYQRLKNQE